MQSGKLPHRITIEHFEETQNQETGHVSRTWSEFTKVWGKLEPLSTKDQLAAQAVSSKMTARCRIRYSSKAIQIDSTMRLMFLVNIGKSMVIRCLIINLGWSGSH